MSTSPFRSFAGCLTTLGVVLTCMALYATTSATRAFGSQEIHGTATAHLHLAKAEGSELVEEGRISGALIGSARAVLHTGSVFTATFTIKTTSGSIIGHGRATPHGSGRYQSFAGSFIATSGTGRYTHITGQSGLYGVFDRRTDAVEIQATGGLTY
jgi:hypothetical protein